MARRQFQLSRTRAGGAGGGGAGGSGAGGAGAGCGGAGGAGAHLVVAGAAAGPPVSSWSRPPPSRSAAPAAPWGEFII